MVSLSSRREASQSWKSKGSRHSEDRLVLLLKEIKRMGSLRAAARILGMDPANGLRLIRRAEAALGTALVRGKTGGRSGGRTTLTERGSRMARMPVDPALPSSTRWPCHLAGPLMPRAPLVVAVPDARVRALVASGPRLEASQSHVYAAGGPLELEIPASAVTLVEFKRTRARSSARNLWPGRVIGVGREGLWGIRRVDLMVGSARLIAAVTASAVRDLGLARGSVVLVQVKATALRVRGQNGPGI